jgi:hypothetical protein
LKQRQKEKQSGDKSNQWRKGFRRIHLAVRK